jgi:hypothetical protein
VCRIAVGRRALCASLVAVAVAAVPAHAQLNTQHIKGAVGLKSGSQPPPNLYFLAPLIYVYTTDTVRLQSGDRLPIDASLSSKLFAGGVNLVTTRRMLGGFYGLQILFPAVANNRIQGTEIDADPGAGLTDSVISPISLGWHFARADAIAAYTLFVPTGRYTDGADDNTGLGMWGQEVSFGSTVYLDAARRVHAAALASFDFQSKKEDSETRVGNVMNLEGGVGADLLGGGLTAGLSYYASFKLTDDRLDGIAGALVRGKNKVFALGPEVQMALARKGTVYGFVKANYQWETYARTTTQGSEFNLQATLLLKPLKVPAP